MIAWADAQGLFQKPPSSTDISIRRNGNLYYVYSRKIANAIGRADCPTLRSATWPFIFLGLVVWWGYTTGRAVFRNDPYGVDPRWMEIMRTDHGSIWRRVCASYWGYIRYEVPELVFWPAVGTVVVTNIQCVATHALQKATASFRVQPPFVVSADGSSVPLVGRRRRVVPHIVGPDAG